MNTIKSAFSFALVSFIVGCGAASESSTQPGMMDMAGVAGAAGSGQAGSGQAGQSGQAGSGSNPVCGAQCGPGTECNASGQCVPMAAQPSGQGGNGIAAAGSTGSPAAGSSGSAQNMGPKCGPGTHVEGAMCVLDAPSGQGGSTASNCGPGTHPDGAGVCVVDQPSGQGGSGQSGQAGQGGSGQAGQAGSSAVPDCGTSCGQGTHCESGTCVLDTPSGNMGCGTSCGVGTKCDSTGTCVVDQPSGQGGSAGMAGSGGSSGSGQGGVTGGGSTSGAGGIAGSGSADLCMQFPCPSGQTCSAPVDANGVPHIQCSGAAGSSGSGGSSGSAGAGGMAGMAGAGGSAGKTCADVTCKSGEECKMATNVGPVCIPASGSAGSGGSSGSGQGGMAGAGGSGGTGGSPSGLRVIEYRVVLDFAGASHPVFLVGGTGDGSLQCWANGSPAACGWAWEAITPSGVKQGAGTNQLPDLKEFKVRAEVQGGDFFRLEGHTDATWSTSLCLNGKAVHATTATVDGVAAPVKIVVEGGKCYFRVDALTP